MSPAATDPVHGFSGFETSLKGQRPVNSKGLPGMLRVRLDYEKRIPMPQPVPEPIVTSELPELARRVIQADRFPVLATLDGDQPRLRPVSPVRTDGFVVFVANLRSYHKTVEIAANPKVELCYLDEHHDQVRITGVATVVTDRSILQEIWDANLLLRQYLRSIDNPEFVLYRIDPQRVRFMREWALDYHDVPLA